MSEETTSTPPLSESAVVPTPAVEVSAPAEEVAPATVHPAHATALKLFIAGIRKLLDELEHALNLK